MKTKTLLLLGNSGVGKTKLLHRLVGNKPKEPIKSTIGVHYSFYQDKDYKLRCWEVCGDSHFNFLIISYAADADIIALVCSPHDEKSIQSLASWYRLVKDSLDDKELILFITEAVADPEKLIAKLTSLRNDVPFQAAYSVATHQSLQDTVHKLSKQQESSAVFFNLYEDSKRTYHGSTRIKKSDLLLLVEEKLALLQKNLMGHGFHKAHQDEPNIRKLLSEIKRGVENDILSIKEQLSAINLKEAQAIVDIIDSNQQVIEMADLDSFPRAIKYTHATWKC